jgi:hypothetical protein
LRKKLKIASFTSIGLDRICPSTSRHASWFFFYIYIYITMNYYLQWNLHRESFEMLSYHLCFFFFRRGWYFGVFSTICRRVINWMWSNIRTSLDG